MDHTYATSFVTALSATPPKPSTSTQATSTMDISTPSTSASISDIKSVTPQNDPSSVPITNIRPQKESKTTHEIRCVAANCEATGAHLYTWPSATRHTNRHHCWTRFVREKRGANRNKGKQWNQNSQSRLCFRHFQETEFVNLVQYKTCPDVQCRLKLKSTAVPTVHLEPGTWSGILSPRKAQAPSMSYRERRGIVRELLAEPCMAYPSPILPLHGTRFNQKPSLRPMRSVSKCQTDVYIKRSRTAKCSKAILKNPVYFS